MIRLIYRLLRATWPPVMLVAFALAIAAVPVGAVIDTAATALDIAEAISANPATVTAANFDALPASGTPNAVSDTPLTAFPIDGDSYGILTSGNASFADDPNDSGSTSADNGGANVRGDTDLDVVVLRLDLQVPEAANCLEIQFQFLSEEYPEYVGSPFNDGFIAELDSSTWTTSGSTITAPDNFAFDSSGDVISVNTTGATEMNPANAAGTTYDGATPLLRAATPISAGAHSLFLSIFDQGDHILDSAVFLDRLMLGTVSDVGEECQPGATPVGFMIAPEIDLNPVGEPHTVTATVTGTGGEPVEGTEIGFDVVSGPNAGEGTTDTTDTNGEASFTYVGDGGIGADEIAATCEECTPTQVSAIKFWDEDCNDNDIADTCDVDCGGFGSLCGLIPECGESLDDGGDGVPDECNTAPMASCVESVNPSGKKTPPAGSTTLPGPKGGQNEDGFYELIGEDAEDGTAPVFVTNASGSATFGPFASGSVVKITEVAGETPTAKPMGGSNSAVAAHIKLDSDAFIFAVDSFGALSPVVSCLVPAPPK